MSGSPGRRDGRVMEHASGALREGQLLGSKYAVERVLGVGGMGLVVAARHVALDRRVALKIMRPETRVDRDLVRRFLREARAAARLTSAHVARVLDVETLDDGTPLIVMEYLEGTDLAKRLRRGPMPVAAAAAILLQACHAIAEAHDLGIVHRDLKPANVFLTRDARGKLLVKVLDLGICKMNEPGRDMLVTTTATLMGTPAYMAPEQMRSGRSTDPRSDIWSMGVMLYEMVCGRLPFSGDTFVEVCLRATLDPPSDLAGTSWPEGFQAVIARCLEKAAAARFGSARELATELARYAGDAALVDPDEVDPDEEDGPPVERTIPAVPSAIVPSRRPRLRALVSTSALLGAVALLGLGLARAGDARGEPPRAGRAELGAPPPVSVFASSAATSTASVAIDAGLRAAPQTSARRAEAPAKPRASARTPPPDPLATPD